MDLSVAREQMIGHQVRAWDVFDAAVLEVMSTVPREEFVPDAYRNLAFADMGIPIGHGHEMLAPKFQGRLLQALEIGVRDEVLEVGTGTGFLTACLARLAGHVTSLDIHEDFTEAAGRRLAASGVGNVRLITEDVFAATFTRRFDAIAVTASAPVYPDLLEGWLKPGGRLFCIVGEAPLMEAIRVRGAPEGSPGQKERLFETLAPALENAPARRRFQF